ncbi:MAG: hypothetical protein NWE89_11665 [Candidatus Bathyarchaeota archaeon]|nr:hypothetical protein [Candidatus Bathyarchaeota archaeon]
MNTRHYAALLIGVTITAAMVYVFFLIPFSNQPEINEIIIDVQYTGTYTISFTEEGHTWNHTFIHNNKYRLRENTEPWKIWIKVWKLDDSNDLMRITLRNTEGLTLQRGLVKQPCGEILLHLTID